MVNTTVLIYWHMVAVWYIVKVRLGYELRLFLVGGDVAGNIAATTGFCYINDQKSLLQFLEYLMKCPPRPQSYVEAPAVDGFSPSQLQRSGIL